MQTDYIIVGQGISGTLLSHSLVKEGSSVVVIDAVQPNSSSRVASGVINPVTGKRVVKTWMIDELLPVALDTYKMLEQELGTGILKQCDILDLFARREEQQVFAERVAEEPQYLQMAEDEPWSSYFRYNYGIGQVSPGYLVDMAVLLDRWRNKLRDNQALLEEVYNHGDCIIEQGRVRYKDISAKAIIYCDGVAGYNNPYFSLLPYSRNKGEVLIASIPGLPREHIYKQGIKIVPWKDDLFWIGASFEWKYEDVEPTAAFRKRVEEHLNYWLRLPYEIVDHRAAERPTTVEYKPFVGMHPTVPQVGVLNGMGTKGCSMAPYFAGQMAKHLLYNEPILADVDVNRFARILTR